MECDLGVQAWSDALKFRNAHVLSHLDQLPGAHRSYERNLIFQSHTCGLDSGRSSEDEVEARQFPSRVTLVSERC